MSMSEANAVLTYWYGGGDKEKRPKWFGGGEKGAEEIKQKFGDLVVKARNNELKHWEDGPKSTFALILLLDQFCRSIYKGTPQAHDYDPYAEQLTKKLLEGNPPKHFSFSRAGRWFIYMPLMHAEDKETQELSLQLYTQLAKEDEEGYSRVLNYAILHKEVVDRFGRFPQRNKNIGRENTPEEEEWLRDLPDKYKW